VVGAFERVDGDVDLQRSFDSLQAAERLTDPQHRRIVPLTFPDGHPAIERNRVEHGAHRLHSRSVRQFPLAAAPPVGGGDGGRFTGAQEVRPEVGYACHVAGE